MGGNCLAEDDTEILHVRNQQLLAMTDDEVSSKLGNHLNFVEEKRKVIFSF